VVAVVVAALLTVSWLLPFPNPQPTSQVERIKRCDVIHRCVCVSLSLSLSPLAQLILHANTRNINNIRITALRQLSLSRRWSVLQRVRNHSSLSRIRFDYTTKLIFWRVGERRVGMRF